MRGSLCVFLSGSFCSRQRFLFLLVVPDSSISVRKGMGDTTCVSAIAQPASLL